MLILLPEDVKRLVNAFIGQRPVSLNHFQQRDRAVAQRQPFVVNPGAFAQAPKTQTLQDRQVMPGSNMPDGEQGGDVQGIP